MIKSCFVSQNDSASAKAAVRAMVVLLGRESAAVPLQKLSEELMLFVARASTLANGALTACTRVS